MENSRVLPGGSERKLPGGSGCFCAVRSYFLQFLLKVFCSDSLMPRCP